MSPSAHPTPWILIPLLLTLAACGGGGGGGDDGPTAFLIAAPEYDGFASTMGLVSFDPAHAYACTGDREAYMSPGYFQRQLFAFHLGSLPAGARVVAAQLRLWQAHVVGDPYGKDGNVIVDHVDYIPAPGPATYDGQNLTRNIGTLSTSASYGLRTLDVTDAVRADRTAGRPWSQFRVRFYSPIIMPIIDHADDYVVFTTAEGVPDGDLPVLIVRYAP